MPQFDLTSFGVQLLSLIFCFLSFYFLFSWKYLPTWAFLLKTRKKHFSSSSLKILIFEDFAFSKRINTIKPTSISKPFFLPSV